MKRRFLIANSDNYEWLLDAHNGNVDVLIAHQDDVLLAGLWQYILNHHEFTDDEVKQLLNNVTNENFWKYIWDNDTFINNLSIEWLIKHQADVDWHYLFNNRDFSDNEVKELLDNVTCYTFERYISNNKDILNNLSIEWFIEHQDNVNWEDIFNNRDFSDSEAKELLNNVKIKDFCCYISNNEYILNNLSIEWFIKHQDDVNWEDIFNNRDFSDSEAQELLNNVKTKIFCYYISNNEYILNNLSIEWFIEHQDNVNWNDILNNRDFSDNEAQELLDNIKAKDFWMSISNNKTLLNKVTVEMLIEHKGSINGWGIINNRKFTNDEKNKLMLTVPKIGACLSKDIVKEENIDLKTLPDREWYNIGGQELHGQRNGAFVVVQDGINGEIDIMFSDKGNKSEHCGMLCEMAKKYGYDDNTMKILLRIEGDVDYGYQVDMLTDDEEKQKALSQ